MYDYIFIYISYYKNIWSTLSSRWIFITHPKPKQHNMGTARASTDNSNRRIKGAGNGPCAIRKPKGSTSLAFGENSCGLPGNQIPTTDISIYKISRSLKNIILRLFLSSIIIVKTHIIWSGARGDVSIWPLIHYPDLTFGKLTWNSGKHTSSFMVHFWPAMLVSGM